MDIHADRKDTLELHRVQEIEEDPEQDVFTTLKIGQD